MSTEVISQKLGTELESRRKWLINNKLSLHLGKTGTILFGSKRIKVIYNRNSDVFLIITHNCITVLFETLRTEY